jgi:hypothetical protein
MILVAAVRSAHWQDVARSDKRTRAFATKLISGSVEWLANFIRETSENDKRAARSRAIMTYCALVGAIIMARAVSDEQLSREILMTVAQLLKNPAPKAASRLLSQDSRANAKPSKGHLGAGARRPGPGRQPNGGGTLSGISKYLEGCRSGSS